MDAIRRIVLALRSADRRLQAELGIGSAQLFVMQEIRKAGTIRVGELALRTATAQSSASEVVARLRARRLVAKRRSGEDRRASELSLTDRGRALVESAPETVQARLLAALRRLSLSQQRDLAELLGRWVTAAGLELTPARMFFAAGKGTERLNRRADRRRNLRR